MFPYELIAETMAQPAWYAHYRVCWDNDGEPENSPYVVLANIPERWLDLIPFMVARRLLELNCNPDRLLIVRLRGADFELVRAPLGVVAAPPLLNFAKPALMPAHRVYREHHHV